ncbi:hypothetical protein MNEG_12783 [Monoraphidium neglectum]|uniref:PB1 domain-containing protein n=1 Tax=Monoraphidium neglectum TaxID=145388 RepID=A0A0D2KHE9_9CHLO|nr:hypothetical protein MNEG_12783 [Monoraphidium neglectum]KIY95178.1 hypothetical protein MNEG_12783 [Monoraphidium neglectum]|eukprot:XP_013894198.1 hypothetical protein MNEG_12783 [Monoraphidium neglectum]
MAAPSATDIDAIVASSSSMMSHSTSQVDVGDSRRIRLRLAFGGSFIAAADGSYRYTGGEYYNESVPADARYADFMYKLGEKFKTAVSVKYQCPGEEMDPGALITVADDDDLAELKEEYFQHLLRPGTPSKTFRIRCFAFAASEDPMTPDEILEGQCFFSHDVVVAAGSGGGRGDGSGGGGGAAPYDSALEQQVLLHSLLPATEGGAIVPASDWGAPSRAVAFASWGGPGKAAASAEMERAALARMRMSINNLSDFNVGAALAGMQTAGALWRGDTLPALAATASGSGLAALSGGFAVSAAGAGGGCGAAGEDDLTDAEFDAADEAEAAVEAYWDRQAAEELLRAASGTARGAERAGVGEAPGVAEPGSARAVQMLPADPFDQEGSRGSSSGGFVQGGGNGDGDGDADADAEALLSAMQEPDGCGCEPGAVGVRVEIVAAAKAAWGGGAADAPLGGANLPSYISAFGDAADGEEGGAAADEDAASGGGGGEEGEDPGYVAAGGGSGVQGGSGGAARPRASVTGVGGGGGGYVPRTQDSGFSLEGERLFVAAGGGGGDGNAGWRGDGGAPPERADSGDSLQSLPKLQPVHRLTRSEVKV